MSKNEEVISDVVVVFKDGHRMEFSDVTDYGVAENGIWYVERFRKHDIWFNPTEILLVGRKFDVDNEPPRGPWF